MIILDFIATLIATLIGVYVAYRKGVSHERRRKIEDDREKQRLLLRAIRKELETDLGILTEFDKKGVYRGTHMFLWTDAYQSGVTAGDRILLDPQLQTQLGLVYLNFKQLDRYGQKLIDLTGTPNSEEAEEEFLTLMEQTTKATLKFIPFAIQAIDSELMKKKDSEFVTLVNSEPRMDIDDLRLVLDSKVQIFTSIWIFGMGLVITLVAIELVVPAGVWSDFLKVGFAAVIVGLYVVMYRLGGPEERLQRILRESDYFDAKEIILKRKAETK